MGVFPGVPGFPEVLALLLESSYSRLAKVLTPCTARWTVAGLGVQDVLNAVLGTEN